MPARSMPLALRAGVWAVAGSAGVAASAQVLVSAAAVRIQRYCRMVRLLQGKMPTIAHCLPRDGHDPWASRVCSCDRTEICGDTDAWHQTPGIDPVLAGGVCLPTANAHAALDATGQREVQAL